MVSLVYQQDGLVDSRREASDAKDMLLDCNINPYRGAENLAYAQNYQHTLKTLKDIHKRVREKYTLSPGDKVGMAAELKDIALAWVKCNLDGMKDPGFQ